MTDLMAAKYTDRLATELTQDELLELLEASGAGDGIRLQFQGKTTARELARRVRPRVTRNVPQLGCGQPHERAKNVLFSGDNLQSMVTLHREHNKVDLIIADPPYNTGNDFRYNDKWDDDPNDPGLGDFVLKDDGARHTKWMKFMWPRLKLMKQMLKPSGVLAICIDHRELFHLGQMLDEPEMFGESNRLGIINWQKSYSPRNDKGHLSTATEYVLIYAKDKAKAKTGLLDRTETMDSKYSNPDGDPDGIWKSGDASAGKGPQNSGMVYAIQSPFTGELHYPPHMGCWRYAQREILQDLNRWGVRYVLKDLEDSDVRAELLNMEQQDLKPAKALVLAEPVEEARLKATEVLKNGPWPRIFFGVKGDGRPAAKRHYSKVKKGVVPMTYWAEDDYTIPEAVGLVSWEHAQSGHSQTGINELDAIVGENHGFSTVKPLRLVEKIIQLWCPPHGTVLDPFAGSGTTGHAVLSLNYQTGAQRRFILIEQGRPEAGDSYAETLTSDRLKRAVTGEWAAGEATPLGGGFSFTRLGKKVDGPGLLAMARGEMLDSVIGSHFEATAKRGDYLVRLDNKPYKYLIAKNSEDEGFFLIWDGPQSNTDFTRDVYEQCADEAEAAGLKSAPYHVYARLYLYQTEGVEYLTIPDRILMDWGLDVRSEPFSELEASDA